MDHKENEYNINDADCLLRECVNAIKGSIDQIYYGLLNYLSEDEQRKFLNCLKNQSDSLSHVLYRSVVEKASKINLLNIELNKTNEKLDRLRQSLEKRVIKRTNEIKKIQHVTIFALARLAESRDRDTGDHLNRIRKCCYLTARELTKNRVYKEYINKKYIDNIYHSSPLHDIGKVGIPDIILLKSEKLTSEELEIMKTHTLIGGKTLEDAERQLKYKTKSFLSMEKNIAFCHHEKWDGSGYPFGLKGKNIPLSARKGNLISLCKIKFS